MCTYASSRVKRKSFYRKRELQMFLLFSGGHIGRPKRYVCCVTVKWLPVKVSPRSQRSYGKKTDCEQSINVTIDCNWLLITLTKGSCNKAVNSLGSVGSAGFAGSAVYSLQFRRFSTRYFGICQFFLQYWGIGYPPMSPSFREELKSRDSQVLIP